MTNSDLPEPLTQLSFCRICESLCGLEIQVADDQVTSVRPDAQHVTTQGFACPKGLNNTCYTALLIACNNLRRKRLKVGSL